MGILQTPIRSQRPRPLQKLVHLQIELSLLRLSHSDALGSRYWSRFSWFPRRKRRERGKQRRRARGELILKEMVGMEAMGAAADLARARARGEVAAGVQVEVAVQVQGLAGVVLRVARRMAVDKKRRGPREGWRVL